MQNHTHDLRVDIISDVVCPWCIIGYRQLTSAAEATGKSLDIHWQPYELNPSMPPEGQNLREHITEKYGSSEEESKQTRERISRLGKELGFRFDFKPESRIINTFAAHKLIHWAGNRGHQTDLKLLLVEKYFTDGMDISDRNILLAAVKELGLDTDEAANFLDDENTSRELRKAEQFWLSNGIQGVPSMVFNQRHLVTGAQGTDNYKQIITQLTADSEVS